MEDLIQSLHTKEEAIVSLHQMLLDGPDLTRRVNNTSLLVSMTCFSIFDDYLSSYPNKAYSYM